MSTTDLTDKINATPPGFRFRDMRWWAWCEDCDEALDSVATGDSANYLCHWCERAFAITAQDWPAAEQEGVERWPGTGSPDDDTFVSHDGGSTWIPLCDKCRQELTPAFTPWQSHRCDTCGWRYLIWAEDWPDYEEEEEEE